METIWEVWTSIVSSRLQNSIVLHDVLHGFRQRRGKGTATMEANLEQQVVGIVHVPLFQVFLGVRKAYNLIYQGRCMEILREYGLGPRLQRLLQRYWDGKRVVTKSGKYYYNPSSREEG